MTLLFRTVFKDNVRLVLAILAIGIAIYLLIDLFERLDNFLDAGVPMGTIVWYFIVKIPLVVSQLLPAIFLLAVVVQLSLMTRSRELIALQSAGISLLHVLKAILLVSLVWACVQLSFSDWIGVRGEQASRRIWQEDVRKRNLETINLHDVWFSEGLWVVYLKELRPDNSGTGFVGYNLSADGLHLQSVVRAERFKAVPNAWTLEDVVEDSPNVYERVESRQKILPLTQNPEAFRLIEPGTKPQQLSLEQLDVAIEQLQETGSNVETLRSVWHMKLAYAASLIVMALVGTVLVMWQSAIMIALPLSLICTLIYYALFTIGTSLGQQGIVPAPLGAWIANIVIGSLALLCFAVKFRKHTRS